MRKHIGAKVISLIVVLLMVFGISSYISTMSLKHSQDTISEIADLYMGIENKNAELLEGIVYVKLYTSNMTNSINGTLATSVSSVAETAQGNLDHIRATVEEMRELCERTGEAELVAQFDAVAVSIEELCGAMDTMIAAALDGRNEAVISFAGRSSLLYKQVEEQEDIFGEMLKTVTDNAVSVSVKNVRYCQMYNMVMIIIYVVVSVVAVIIVNHTVVRPARKASAQLGSIIEKIDNNEGDLTERIEVKTQDEVGRLVQGINAFIEKLESIMKTIQTESRNMTVSVASITEGINSSNDNASDVSAVMEELSASMEEVSATVSQISLGADEVLEASKGMSVQAKNGADFVKEIKDRAQVIKTDTIASKENTSQMIVQNREMLQVAINNSRSVEQINGLTEEILNISGQTNLLALNASIEAARAGDAGKGFAVVAEEIRVLADNSKNTANNIQEISNQVTKAVRELSKNANAMLAFIDETVLVDYDKFVDVAVKYDEDADSMDAILKEFWQGAHELEGTMEQMTSGLEGINSAIDESAQGIGMAAASTNQLVEALSEIRDEANANNEVSELLSSEVERFKNI